MPLAFRHSAAPLAPACLGLLLGLAAGSPAVMAAPQCTYLQPIGGDGRSPIVSKQVGPARLLGKTNWDTDFIVDRPYGSYRFIFTANSSSPAAIYPVSGFMKFTDGTSLRLFEETIRPKVGASRTFGPFPAVPGKTESQMNVKVGSASEPGALGHSYLVSVQGCR